MHPSIKKVIYSAEVESSLAKRKKQDRNFFNQVTKQIEKILKEPALGKPLRYSLKNQRRIHIGSFVLIYELREGELRFIDLDHHDKVYRK